MKIVRLFFVFTTILSGMLLALGLYKPWFVLWWEDTQNRKKVITIYGSILLVSVLIYFIFSMK